MNPLLLIGAAILVTGLLVLVATMLLRPTSSRSHLSVAELQARLAQEQEDASPASEGSEKDETASDEDTRTDGKPRLTMPAVRRQLPYPIADNDDAKREPTSTSDKGLRSEAASTANDNGSQSAPTSTTNDDRVRSEAASTTNDDSTQSEPASATAADLDPAQAQRRAAAAEMLRRITSA